MSVSGDRSGRVVDVVEWRSVDNVLVDFIGQDDAINFLSRKEFARGVVRRIENNGLGVRRDFGAQRVFLQDPGAAAPTILFIVRLKLQRYIHRHAAS